jgi:hypothetical protein
MTDGTGPAADDFLADLPGQEALAGMARWLTWPKSVLIGVGVFAALFLMGLGALLVLLATRH